MMAWNSRYGNNDSYFPPYVSASEQKERNAKMDKKLVKNNSVLQPVIVQGRVIAKSFWAKAWCRHLEQFHDYSNRLARGRSYVRNGAVLDLKITQGLVEAKVAGSYGKPYQISIEISPLSPKRREQLLGCCVGKIDSILDLLQGKIPESALEQLCGDNGALLPKRKEMRMHCNCPDSARMCKHIVAVICGIGVRLDEDAALLFHLRGLELSELVAEAQLDDLTGGRSQEIKMDRVSDIFDISFDDEEESPAPTPTPTPAPTPEPEAAPRAKKSSSKKKASDGIAQLRQLKESLQLHDKDIAPLLSVQEKTVMSWLSAKRKMSLAAQARLKEIMLHFGLKI